MKKAFFITISGYTVAEKRTADDLDDLIQNRMTKRERERWDMIEFVDTEGRRIAIDRDCFDESGWTLEEMIQDFVWHSDERDFAESIHYLPRGKSRGLIIYPEEVREAQRVSTQS